MVVVRALVAWLLVSGVALAQDAPIPNTPTHVIVDSCASCGGGTTDTDDGSIAAGQVTSIPIALNYIYNGATWGRLTFGQTTMAASLPVVLASNQFPAGATPADNETNATTITRVGTYPFIWDGVNWDRWTGTVNGTVNVGNTIAVNQNSNPWNTAEVAPTTVFSGKTTIATCGTSAAIRASQAAKGVTVKALTTNTGLIYVGPSGVASTTGIQLNAGEAVSMNIDNFATVFFDCQTNGEGVTYLGVN